MVDSFDNKIKYEHYIGNIYVSIEVIVLENFSDLQQPSPYLESVIFSCRAVFRSIFIMTENMIMPLHIYTVKALFNC